MRNAPKKRMQWRAAMVALVVPLLAACQSPPPLKQVADDAQDKPINSPEVAAILKQKYEKK